MRRRADLSKLVQLACDRYGKLDVLVSNAGILRSSPFGDTTPEDMRDVVVEMLDRLESSATNTAEDENLRVRFDAVATNSRSFGNASIGRDFLRIG